MNMISAYFLLEAFQMNFHVLKGIVFSFKEFTRGDWFQGLIHCSVHMRRLIAQECCKNLEALFSSVALSMNQIIKLNIKHVALK